MESKGFKVSVGGARFGKYGENNWDITVKATKGATVKIRHFITMNPGGSGRR